LTFSLLVLKSFQSVLAFVLTTKTLVGHLVLLSANVRWQTAIFIPEGIGELEERGEEWGGGGGEGEGGEEGEGGKGRRAGNFFNSSANEANLLKV
jgi:hypothetical protein